MAIEQVDRVHRLAPHLGIEIEAAGGEPARAQDFEIGERQFLDRIGELIGVPAILRIAAVRIDRAEDAERRCGGDLVLEGVAGEGCVVRLDIDLHFILKAIALEETVHRSGVKVVLVLGRLERLGFDQDRAGETDLVLVLDDERQEAAEIVELALKIGVEQRLIALTTAPQHIVRATQTMRGFKCVAHLHRAEREHFRVGVGRATSGKARMAEQVGGAPQQLAARRCLKLLEMIDGFGEIAAMLGDSGRIGHHVDIVEAVIGNIELGEELERNAAFMLGGGGIIGTGMPRTVERTPAEHVRPRPAEGVPEAGGEAQMVFHPLAEHDPVLVVETVCKLVVGAWALEGDLGNIGEEIGGHRALLGGQLE
ncbi:unnamed protein product [Rhizophagus irregularis]|uniref:Uncharacterized protein n=1 Tax=Rhizophagus irregularis TaxID=588596 RepID=A0A916E8E7_9GLOM|nr:unnamed protein product [Rhizophagus irregularis]